MRALLFLLPLAACAPERRPPDPFARTGELLALSGGDAGAENACIGCHGLAGEGNGAGAPRLAGIDRGYLVRQLGFYAEGLRQHAQMHAIAKRLSWDARDRLAAYYAALPPVAAAARPLPVVPALWSRGDPARGIGACASCHGTNGEGGGLGNPALAGQPAGYLAAQHYRWRRGERRGDPLGVMTRISQAMTPAEISAVSDYAAALSAAAPRPARAAASPPARRAGPRNGA